MGTHTSYDEIIKAKNWGGIVRKSVLLGLLICVVYMLGIRAAGTLQGNWAVLQIAHLGTTRPPFQFDNLEITSVIPKTDHVVSERLAHIQVASVIEGDSLGVLALAGAYLANGEPARVEQLLNSNNAVVARYLKAVACYLQSFSECELYDPVVAKGLSSSGLNLWLTHHFTAGFHQLRLAELLDNTASPDKALAYTILSAGANTILHDGAEAVRWAQLRIQVQPAEPDGYLSLAALYLSSGKIELASTTLRIVEPMAGQSNWRFYSLRGQTAWALTDREGALQDYFQAYQLNPAETLVAWYLGSALTSMGRGEEACPYLNAVAHNSGSQDYDRYLAGVATNLLEQIGGCPR